MHSPSFLPLCFREYSYFVEIWCVLKQTGFSYVLTKVYTLLLPWVQRHWCRKSELPRTPLFNKHSDCEEKLIIQTRRSSQLHLSLPQKPGGRHDADFLQAFVMLAPRQVHFRFLLIAFIKTARCLYCTCNACPCVIVRLSHWVIVKQRKYNSWGILTSKQA